MKAQQGVDWDSCQTKYIWIHMEYIWSAFIEQYPTPQDGQLRGTAYPHATDEIIKTQISPKLKAIRSKYSDAVDMQRRSGHG